MAGDEGFSHSSPRMARDRYGRDEVDGMQGVEVQRNWSLSQCHSTLTPVSNQAAFPQPRTQKPGLGFPQCRLLALMCLSSGAVLDTATGATQGNGSDENSLLRSLLDHLEAGDILLGDAFFSTCFLLADLKGRGIAGVFEQFGARRRSTDFRRGRRLGERDHVIELRKPPKRPDWMTQSQ
ncbi:hypothetical protein [Pseudomarimonas salicorniae]|uniref:Transposase DDE domain-containing protein n=1 Tax=Pseudomarimonas salicorniae TaxID=2933270 RepID=A0ABT0GGP6_9GAMM|nr:hypothetical protein [Lysobacter sp. CAU 1642]MCK7593706.1 hypothetical protein [Lysobacter sp. CAU 1642]